MFCYPVEINRLCLLTRFGIDEQVSCDQKDGGMDEWVGFDGVGLAVTTLPGHRLALSGFDRARQVGFPSVNRHVTDDWVWLAASNLIGLCMTRNRI